jgi:hypothetical protein
MPVSKFVDCCHVHDICYEICGNDKDECDLKFKKCLYKKCSAQKDSVSKYVHKGETDWLEIIHIMLVLFSRPTIATCKICYCTV